MTMRLMGMLIKAARPLRLLPSVPMAFSGASRRTTLHLRVILRLLKRAAFSDASLAHQLTTPSRPPLIHLDSLLLATSFLAERKQALS